MFNIARRTSTSAYELISGGRKQIADDAEHASPLLSAGESLKNWTSTVSPDVAELQRKGENRPKGVIRRCLQAVCAVIGTGITIALWRYHSELTSIAVFAGGAFMFVSCVLMVWFDFVMAIWRGDPAAHDYVGRSRLTRTLFAGSTLLTVWLLVLLLSPTRTLDVSVPRAGEKYFIGANLYNNEARMPQWTGELVHLIEYLGPENVFVSIYESNSRDATSSLLSKFGEELEALGVDHRIDSVANDGRGQFGIVSPERIAYMSATRNKVLEPIQSSDPAIRLSDWTKFTKIIFMNDVVYRWQDIARLIDTKQSGDVDAEYDMACGVDHWEGGFYDTWVARDICGSPLRKDWPYVRDSTSRRFIRSETPFPVATCWNGVAVLKAEPLLFGFGGVHESAKGPLTLSIREQEWAMIDNGSSPGGVSSPRLNYPLRFRTSGVETCNHSECFLLPYDLHRLYRNVEGRPKIILNPTVKLAYTDREYNWWNVVCRTPIIKWWRDVWSHGILFVLTGPISDFREHRRDRCTWAGLKIPQGHCPPLPGRLLNGEQTV